jgi:glycosyltransferase involved in cell wall biosynthesis
MDTLRVVLVGPYPASEGKVFGGVEAVTSSLADGLAEVDGVEAHAITSVPGLKHPEDRVTATGVHVHLLPLFGRLGCMTGFAIDRGRVRGKLREVEPDIVHVHTQLIYGHTAFERGWPSVLTMHGIFYREIAQRRGLWRLQGLFGCACEANSVRRARHISAINRYSADAFGKYVRTDDVRYIDNPINDRWFGIDDRAEPGRILFGGFIYDLKNLLYLLQAIAELAGKHPHLRLRVAGGVREQDYYQRCVSFVSEHGIEKNVEFLGALSVDEMMEEHSKASMLVVCSKQENSPVIISEAMAAGKPVIGTNVGGVAEQVADGESGFVVPLDDPAELARRIDCILSDEQLRRQMGKAGKAIAERRFRRSVVVGKTIEFYKDVIEHERGRQG